MVTIYGTKQKEETYGLIVRAWDDCAENDTFTIVQANDLGGRSLEKMLKSTFPLVTSESYDKARHITITKTDDIDDDTKMTLQGWRAYNELSYIEDIGFYSMPGIFGWNKIDKGSQLLSKTLPDLRGVGADFGCGYGYLTQFLLTQNADIETLYAFDIDPRAVQACRKNVTDDRAVIEVGDCTHPIASLPKLDFIVMNPPFHDGGQEDKALGQAFIKTAAHHLKRKGTLYMVANNHLPYEKILNQEFQSVEKIFEGQGFKIFKT